MRKKKKKTSLIQKYSPPPFIKAASNIYPKISKLFSTDGAPTSKRPLNIKKMPYSIKSKATFRPPMCCCELHACLKTVFTGDDLEQRFYGYVNQIPNDYNHTRKILKVFFDLSFKKGIKFSKHAHIYTNGIIGS